MNRAEAAFVKLAYEKLSTPALFKHWLLEQGWETIVGFAYDACKSPLAVFSQHLGFPVVGASPGGLDINVGGSNFTALGSDSDGNDQDNILSTRPEEAIWWWDFAWNVDDLHAPETPITALRAFAIIKAIEDLDAVDAALLEDVEALEAQIKSGALFKAASELVIGDEFRVNYYDCSVPATVIGTTVNQGQNINILAFVPHPTTFGIVQERFDLPVDATCEMVLALPVLAIA